MEHETRRQTRHKGDCRCGWTPEPKVRPGQKTEALHEFNNLSVWTSRRKKKRHLSWFKKNAAGQGGLPFLRGVGKMRKREDTARDHDRV